MVGGLVLATALVTALGCTKPSSGSGSGGSGPAAGGTVGSGGSTSTGAGGTVSTGAGGSSATGTGGAITTGTGGTPSTGTGGTPVTGTGGASASGNGGATGAGGATGTGGAGGATVVQKLCATKTVVMNPVFMNFENYNGTTDPGSYATAFGGATTNTGNAYAGIYQYPEAAGSPAPTLTIGGGHPPSTWAGGETLAATMWGMGGGIWMGCADASAYKGISFWVRGTSGTGTFSFTIAMESTVMPDAANAAGGGTCPGTTDATCKAAEKDGIPITTDWTQVQLLWSDFTAGVSGTASVVPDGNNITGFGWTVPLAFEADPSKPADAGVYIPVPESLTINIDDVTFIQ